MSAAEAKTRQCPRCGATAYLNGRGEIMRHTYEVKTAGPIIFGMPTTRTTAEVCAYAPGRP